MPNAKGSMSWHIKNTGNVCFGVNCRLEFVSGDAVLVSSYHIPNALPNDTSKVRLHFQAFDQTGSYSANFRLSTDGAQFGPHLNVKMKVVDLNEDEDEQFAMRLISKKRVCNAFVAQRWFMWI